MLRRTLALTLLGGTLLLGAGCGSDEVATARPVTVDRIGDAPTPPHTAGRLTEKQAFTIGVATTAVDRCTEPERADLPPLRGFVGDLIALAERKPDVLGSAFGEPDTTARAGLAEVAETLEQAGCQLDQARRARATLAQLPPSP